MTSVPDQPPPPAAPPAFDDYADDYDAALERGISLSGEHKDYFAEQRVRWLARRLQRAGARPTRILDFGCGTGTAMPYLRQAFPDAELVGTDISERSLAQARKAQSGTGAQFHPYPVYRTPRPFDLVFSNGVFHHIPPAERAGAVEYLQASMAAGGWFALWENNPWNPGTRLVMSRIPFDRDAITLTPPEARALLRAGGLTPRRTDALFIFPHALRALRFVEPWLASLPLGAQYLVLAQRPA